MLSCNWATSHTAADELRSRTSRSPHPSTLDQSIGAGPALSHHSMMTEIGTPPSLEMHTRASAVARSRLAHGQMAQKLMSWLVLSLWLSTRRLLLPSGGLVKRLWHCGVDVFSQLSYRAAS